VDIVLVGAEVMIELNVMRPHRFIHKGVESDFSDVFGMVEVLRVIPEVPRWGVIAWGGMGLEGGNDTWGFSRGHYNRLVVRCPVLYCRQ
jgi:hypothetical protein